MFESKTVWMRLIIFLFAVCLHAALLAFFSFPAKSSTRLPSAPAARTMHLVHIQEELPPPPKPPQQKFTLTPPPSPELSAETFIEITEEQQAALPVQEAASDTGKQQADAAEKNAYIKKNYGYIQRRIRDKLIYPSQARRAGMQGLAEVLFTIHLDGSVSGVSLYVSSGQAMLDQAALEAVYAAAPFKPPPPSVLKMVIPVSFKLR
jgi:protein TonB